MDRRPKGRRPIWFSTVFVLVVAGLILILRLTEDIGPEGFPGQRFSVVRVIDGDTMELPGGDRLRLLAIDTPEEGEPFHDSATALVERLVRGQAGRVEYAEKRRDRYGRLLGYYYIDTLLVNKVLIDSGYGNVYLFADNELMSPEVRRLLEAQRSAIKRGVGIWSLNYEPEPRYINKTGSFRLHRPGCRSVADLTPGAYRVFDTREEGLATGLSPCRNCKP